MDNQQVGIVGHDPEQDRAEHALDAHPVNMTTLERIVFHRIGDPHLARRAVIAAQNHEVPVRRPARVIVRPVSEAVYGDRMSASDTLLWNNERDPMLRSTIISMIVLDGPPDPVRFAGAVERSLARVPRLRQRVVLDPLPAALGELALDAPVSSLCSHRLAAPRGLHIGDHAPCAFFCSPPPAASS